jgi:hypothetical protein
MNTEDDSRKKPREDRDKQTAEDKELQLAKLEAEKLQLQRELLEAQLKQIGQRQEQIRTMIPLDLRSDLSAPFVKLTERRRQEQAAAAARSKCARLGGRSLGDPRGHRESWRSIRSCGWSLSH